MSPKRKHITAMMTLEQAINRLEDMVSGCYQQQFLESDLRNNTKESAELLKFSFMSLVKLQNVEVRKQAFHTIINTVLDDTPLPKQWQKKGMTTLRDRARAKEDAHMIMQYPEVDEECIDCCNVILQRLAEDETPEMLADHALQSLNRRYRHKYFYFRSNDVGSQYVYVKRISRDKDGHFLLDGTVIYTNGVNNTIGLYDVKEAPVEDFYNFGDKQNRFTDCDAFEEALLKPMDTRLKSHVITCREVAEDILFIFTWFYEIHLPELAKILKTLKIDI